MHIAHSSCVCERGYPKTPLEGTAERGHCSGQLRLKILHRLVQDGDALTVPVVLETLLVPWLCLFCWLGGCDASVTLFSSVGDSTGPLNVSVLEAGDGDAPLTVPVGVGDCAVKWQQCAGRGTLQRHQTTSPMGSCY